MRSILRLLTFLAALSPLAESSAAEPHRVALVVGNAAYAAAPLAAPVGAARAMSLKLAALGFDVTKLENATRQQLERAILQLGRRLDSDSVALFYFAGHAVQAGGRDYLVPVDAEIDAERKIRLNAVELDAVLDQLSGTRGVPRFVILDTARDNGFERRFRTPAGLARLDAPLGMLVAFAASPGTLAPEDNGRNLRFTERLLVALDRPGLGVEPLFDEVRQAVTEATHGAQVPWRSTALGADFSFRPAAAVASAPGAGAASSDVEIVFWQSIQDSGNPADFEDYLKQFPAGAFRPLAERRLAAIRVASAVKGEAGGPAGDAPSFPQRARSETFGMTVALDTPPAAESDSRERPPVATLDGSWIATGQACRASGELLLRQGKIAGTIRFGEEQYEVAGALDEDWRISLFLNLTGLYGRRLEGRFPVLEISLLLGQGSHGAGTGSTFATDCATSLTFAQVKG